MKITQIKCSGFMGYVDLASIELGNLTVLCGENGTGKSTWFKILRMIKDVFSNNSGIENLITSDIINKSDSYIDTETKTILSTPLEMPYEITIELENNFSFETIFQDIKKAPNESADQHYSNYRLNSTKESNKVELSWKNGITITRPEWFTQHTPIFEANIWDSSGDNKLLNLKFTSVMMEYTNALDDNISKRVYVVKWQAGSEGLITQNPEDETTKAIAVFFKLLFNDYRNSIFYLSSVRSLFTSKSFQYRGYCYSDRWVGSDGEKAIIQLICHSKDEIPILSKQTEDIVGYDCLATEVGKLMQQMTGVSPYLLRYPVDDGSGCTEILPTNDNLYIEGGIGFPTYVMDRGGDLTDLFCPGPLQCNIFNPVDKYIPARNMSNGFQQLLPIIVQICLLKENDLFLLENPEVHIHPKLQLQLTEFIIEEINQGKNIMIETHSDVILRRIVRRLLEKEQKLSTDKVKIYFSKIEDTKGKISNIFERKSGASDDVFKSAIEEVKKQNSLYINDIKEKYLSDDEVALLGQGKTSTIEEISVKEGKINFPKDFLSDIQDEIEALSNVLLKSSSTYPNKDISVEELIRIGESDTVEFKETLKTPIKGNVDKKVIEFAAIKTIAAFLNSKGGTLLIGIDKNSNIVGIQADDFSDKDKLRLYFDNLIKNYFGGDIWAFIDLEIKPIHSKEIIRIDCKPSNKPEYIMNLKEQKEFYIRRTASSISLDIEESFAYIHNRFLKLQK